MAEYFLLCYLFLAAVFDGKTRKIPNRLILVGLIAGVFLRFTVGGLREMLVGILHTFFWIALCFPLFRLRMIGAGDCKLTAVMIFLCGFSQSIPVIGAMLFLAGCYSLWKMLHGHMFLQRMRYAYTYFVVGKRSQGEYDSHAFLETKYTIPLAPFLFIAYLLVMLGRWCGLW